MTDLITLSQKYFEAIKHTIDEDAEYWYARDLMDVLEYESWQKFKKLIERSIAACEKSGESVENHFIQLDNMVDIGSGATRRIDNFALTRYACYLIAMNGDPKKKEKIALAQTYFAFQTRKQEVYRDEMANIERLSARQKLTETEKEFSSELISRGLSGRQVGEVRATGDRALFGGFTTKDMKKKLKIKEYKPLADHLPTITLKAKDLATEMTTHKTKDKDTKSSQEVKQMHVGHNNSVRLALTSEGIYPENLPPEEDIKKIERRIKKNDDKALESAKKPPQIKPR
ncbi:DNA damage-inducible protein D [Patescibacteria group bacterium]|nr:DNA damage-inducible protein D [Patescibacteria group bacterium]MBU1885992.1 DNA damage-inducible protein D [Patescibacteria group bacterium]